MGLTSHKLPKYNMIQAAFSMRNIAVIAGERQNSGCQGLLTSVDWQSSKQVKLNKVHCSRSRAGAHRWPFSPPQPPGRHPLDICLSFLNSRAWERYLYSNRVTAMPYRFKELPIQRCTMPHQGLTIERLGSIIVVALRPPRHPRVRYFRSPPLS